MIFEKERQGMQVTKAKDSTLQILRGLAITVVLVHHAISRIGVGGWMRNIDEILICFHMPAFFIVSGFLYQRNLKKYESEGKWNFLQKKAKHLLIPYMFWYVLLWIGVQVACLMGDSVKDMLTGIGFAPMGIGEMLYGLLTFEIYYVEHLWFLYVLFLYFLIHSLIGELGSSEAIFVIGILMGVSTCVIAYPNIISRFMIWFVFFSFGRFMERHEEVIIQIKEGKWLAPLLLFVVLSIARIFLFDVEPEINKYVLAIVRQIIKYTLGFLGVWLLYMVDRYLNRIKNRLTILVKIIGDYSYDIYLMHNPYFLALSSTVLYGFLGVNALLTIVIAVILGVSIPMIASKFIIRRFKILSFVMLGEG
ncbi:MAG: acyltransferase [Clostridia bacterium]|nr:acyltransferase [Clostridia bacterium]